MLATMGKHLSTKVQVLPMLTKCMKDEVPPTMKLKGSARLCSKEATKDMNLPTTVRPQPVGEDTKNRGRGGRAGEFCLGLALGLQGQSGVYALAADTDGIDGLEDNAGAYVAPDTLARAQAAGLKVDRYLDRNDAYGYFKPLGDLVITGPTHTNVNDFRAILIL